MFCYNKIVIPQKCYDFILEALALFLIFKHCRAVRKKTEAANKKYSANLRENTIPKCGLKSLNQHVSSYGRRNNLNYRAKCFGNMLLAFLFQVI